MQKYPAIFSMWRFVEDLGQSNQLSLLKPFTASFHPNTKTLYKRGECGDQITGSCSLRVSCSQALRISKDGDFTTSLGSMGQCWATLGMNFSFLIFIWIFLCCNLCPLPLVTPFSFPALMKNKNKKILSLSRKDKLPAFWLHYLQLGTVSVNAAWPENF